MLPSATYNARRMREYLTAWRTTEARNRPHIDDPCDRCGARWVGFSAVAGRNSKTCDACEVALGR